MLRDLEHKNVEITTIPTYSNLTGISMDGYIYEGKYEGIETFGENNTVNFIRLMTHDEKTVLINVSYVAMIQEARNQ